MKEINDIITSYNKAKAAGKKTALATVVKVEGSSYRQPGARMLVTEHGELTGAISGGCLEGDALKKALVAINLQKNKLVIYDTSDESDLEFGVQLGCNGIVYILFEPIDDVIADNQIALLKKITQNRQDNVLATLFSLDNDTHPGTIYLHNSIEGDNNNILDKESKVVLQDKKSLIKSVTFNNAEYNLLLQYIPPVVSLIIAGAGNDAFPLVKAAYILGWHITVVDGRATHATPKRFTEADNVIIAKPEQLIEQLVIDKQTVFVVMTHNYNYDLALLKELLNYNCIYIGMLGPKTKLNRMLDDLTFEGIKLTEQQLQSIYGPVGLDIGAETAEEIAISVIAEIKAVLEGKTGTSLKFKTTKIHDSAIML